MVLYSLALWALLLLTAVETAQEATTQGTKAMIDEKSEKTQEDLEKVKKSLMLLNIKSQKHMRSGGNDNEENPHLKAVMELDLGPKSNETVDESAINAGIAEYVMGGDIAVNPEQAAALVSGTAVKGAEMTTKSPEKKERRKRASLFDLPQVLDDFSKILFASPAEANSTKSHNSTSIELSHNHTIERTTKRTLRDDQIAAEVDNAEESLSRKRASLFDLPQVLDDFSKILFASPAEANSTESHNSTSIELSHNHTIERTTKRTLRDDQIAAEVDNAEESLPVIRSKRGYQTDPKYAWDISKPISYFFDPSFPPSRIPVVRQGIAFWHNNSCVNFVEDANGDSALRIFSGGGCYASLGRQGTKTQDVSIGNGCDNLGTVTHELNHALGFFHTMSRPDRDSAVSVNQANIQSNQVYNFVKNDPSADNSYNVPFDYGSVMLYNQYAFATDTNIPTTVALNKWMQNTMGQRTGPAFSDIKQVNMAFKCDATCAGKTCSNGGFANSKDCTKCVCPRGFGGDSCDSLATSDAPVCNGGTLTADVQPQTVVASVGTNDFVPYPVASNCYWMINAPAGKKVVFNLTAAPSSCVQNCAWQGVEILMGNFDTYGVTMCCPSMVGQEFTATGNMAIIRGYARSNLANFSFQYRYF